MDPLALVRTVPRLALLVLALGALAATASAQSSRRGPGPFPTGGEFRDGRLVLHVSLSAASSVPFASGTRLFATRDGGGWRPFDERARVGDDGSRLTQAGSIDGIDLDAYFEQQSQRRLLVEAPDGTSAELDVVRANDFLLILRTNRSPAAIVTTHPFATPLPKIVDVLGDRSVTLRLGPEGSTTKGYDVVVGLTADTPPEINTRSAILVATSDTTGATFSGETSYFGTAGTLFTHFVLPEGAYTLRADESLTIGNPAVATTSFSFSHPELLHMSVTARDRLFAVALPPPTLPPLVDGSVTIGGLDGLEPSFARRYDVFVQLSSVDGSASVSASRDVGDGSPLTIPIRAPSGRYTVRITAFRGTDDPNGVSIVFATPLGEVDHHGAGVEVALPPLVRLTGTLGDPSLALLSSPDPLSGSTPSHSISVADASPTNGFTAGATLRGFARGYSLYVPAGALPTLTGQVTVALGKRITRDRSSLNDLAVVSLVAPEAAGPCEEDCEADLVVPAIGPVATLSGTIVDANGRPQREVVVSASLEHAFGEPGATLYAFVRTSASGAFTMRLPRAAGYRLAIYRFR